jgi:uncharacterized membrane protein YhaH (DUF805 family)
MKKMTFWQILFSFDGRLGRANFFGGQIIATILQIAAIAVFVSSAGYSFYYLIEDLLNLNLNFSRLLSDFTEYSLIAVALIAISTWIGLATLIKRFHDLNASGCLAFLLPLINFIPAVGTVLYYLVILILVFWGGTEGPNSHGIGTDYPSKPEGVEVSRSQKQFLKQPSPQPLAKDKETPSYIKILKDRYAAGEISTEEYREKLAVFSEDEPSSAVGHIEPTSQQKKEIRMETREETEERLRREREQTEEEKTRGNEQNVH